MNCCFDGYSDFELSYASKEDYIKLGDSIMQVLKQLIYEGYDNYLCGFDRGSDLIFAENVIKLKSQYKGIKLESILPCEEHATHWTESDRDKYFSLLAECDKETMLRTHYEKDCFFIRNKFMVGKSDALIAVYDGKLSLTMQTVNFARRLCKRVICINPATYSVTEFKHMLPSVVNH
jgi:uncharacterized phage-like protein YoqJ